MAWFGGKIDLNSIKNQVANTLKEVLDEDEEETSKRFESSVSSLEDLQVEIAALKKRNEDLQLEKETESRQLKDLLIEKEDEIQQLQGWASPREDASQDLVTKIQELENKLKDVSGRAGPKKRSESFQEKETSHVICQTERCEDESEVVLQLKDDIDKLKSELLQKNELIQLRENDEKVKLKEYKTSIQSLQAKIVECSKESQLFQEQKFELDHHKVQLTEQTERRKTVEQQLQEKVKSIESLQNKIVALENEKTNEDQQRDEMTQSMNKMKKLLLEKEKAESLLKDELSNLKDQAVDVGVDNQDSIVKELEESHAIVLNEKNEAIDTLKAKISSLESEVKTFKEFEINETKKDELILSENRKLSEALDQQQREKELANANSQQLSISLSEKEEELKKQEKIMEDYVSSKEIQIKELEEKLATTQDNSIGLNKQVEKEKDEKDELISSLESKISELQLENAQLHESQANSENKLLEIQNEFDNNNSHAEEVISNDIKEELENIKNALEVKENLISEKDKELLVINEWKEDALRILQTNSMHDFTDHLEELLRNKEILKHQLKNCLNEETFGPDFDSLSIEKIIQILDGELKSYSEKCLEFEKSVESLQNENRSLQMDVQSKESSLNDLNQTLKSLRKSNEDLEDEAKKFINLNDKYMENEHSLEKANERLQSCENELSVLKDENSTIEKERESLQELISQMKLSEASTVESVQSLKNENKKLSDEGSRDQELIMKLTDELNVLKEKTFQLSTLEQQNLDANKVIEKLSSLVNDKDLEIDSLKLKGESLSSIAYQKNLSACNESSELKNRVNNMLKERQEMINTLQLKHEESVRYHTEVERLSKVVAMQDSEILNLKEKSKDAIIFSESSLPHNKTTRKRFLSEGLLHNALDSSQIQSIDDNEKEKDISKDTDISMSNLKDELNLTIQELMTLRQENNELQETQNRLQLTIKEKEYDLLMANKNLEHIEGLLKEKEESFESQRKEINQLKSSIEELKREAQSLKQGKNNADTVVSSKDRELMELRREVNNLIDKKRKLEQEFERLKQHLVSVEDGYTQDAIEYQSREQDLKNKLMSTEEALRISSAQHSTAIQEATQLGGSLGTQVTRLKDERDDALKKYCKLNKDFKEQTKAVENLQMALDGFRREQENEIRFSQQYLEDKLNSEKEKIQNLEHEIVQLKAELDASRESLSNRQSLVEQLEHKSHIITTLKQEINSREELLKSARNELSQANQSQSVKVDKNLIKNLVVGYAAADENKKIEVLKIIGTVLDFNPEERKKSGLDGGNWSWFGGSSKGSSDIDQSLASAFVKFLETESTSNSTILPVPTETSKPSTPVLTTPSNVHLPGHKRTGSNGSVASDRSSPNLLLNNPSGMFPTLMINRSSSSILKHVLLEDKDKE